MTPPGYDTRTRVHEYGGGAVWYHGGTVFFSEFSTGRLHRQDGRGCAAGADHAGAAGAELASVRGRLRHAGRRDRHLCAGAARGRRGAQRARRRACADGSAEPRIVASGHDFDARHASTRPAGGSPGSRGITRGCRGTAPSCGSPSSAKTAACRSARLVAGGPSEAILDPQWSPDGALHFCTDRNGWWNLYRVEEDGGERCLTRLEGGEIGGPAWVFGTSYYAFLGDGRIACVVTRAATDTLELLEPDTGTLEPAGLGWTAYASTALAAGDGKVAFAAASPVDAETVVV